MMRVPGEGLGLHCWQGWCREGPSHRWSLAHCAADHVDWRVSGSFESSGKKQYR